MARALDVIGPCFSGTRSYLYDMFVISRYILARICILCLRFRLALNLWWAIFSV